MKFVHKILMISILCSSLTGCKSSVKACVEKDEYIAKAGDTIRINSCSENTEAYVWELDSDVLFYDVSSVIIEETDFLDNYVVSGGEGCEDYIEIVFTKPGTYKLLHYAPKLINGTSCSSHSHTYSYYRETSTQIIITP